MKKHTASPKFVSAPCFNSISISSSFSFISDNTKWRGVLSVYMETKQIISIISLYTSRYNQLTHKNQELKNEGNKRKQMNKDSTPVKLVGSSTKYATQLMANKRHPVQKYTSSIQRLHGSLIYCDTSYKIWFDPKTFPAYLKDIDVLGFSWLSDGTFLDSTKIWARWNF